MASRPYNRRTQALSLGLIPKIPRSSRSRVKTLMHKKATLNPRIRAAEEELWGKPAATAFIMPTNTAVPMAPAMVRRDVSSAVPWAVRSWRILPVPQVTRGIIRQPMEMFRITLLFPVCKDE